MANKMNSTKVVTGVVRLSYANVWEPASINGSNPKYSVSLIIPKSDKQTLDAINAAVDAAIKEGVAKFGGKIPNKAALKLPLRDGDTERDDEAYKNSFFVNANSTTAPQIVDRSVQPMDIVLLSKCAELWVFGEKITSGMSIEIEKAKRKGQLIRYFTENCEEVHR